MMFPRQTNDPTLTWWTDQLVDWSVLGTVASLRRNYLSAWSAKQLPAHLLYAKEVGGLTHVCFSPTGEYLALALRDGPVQILDAFTGRLMSTTHLPQASSLSWSPDGTGLAMLCGQDGRILVWDIATECCRYEKQFLQDGLSVVAWSPDGSQIAAAGFSGTVYLFSAQNGGEHSLYLWNERGIYDVQWSPDSSRLVAALPGRGVEVLGFRYPEHPCITHRFYEYEYEPFKVRYSPDGRFIAALDYMGFRLWDAKAVDPYPRIMTGCVANSLCWSSDAQKVVLGDREQGCSLYNLPVLTGWGR